MKNTIIILSSHGDPNKSQNPRKLKVIRWLVYEIEIKLKHPNLIFMASSN
jgi:hypothetical protein